MSGLTFGVHVTTALVLMSLHLQLEFSHELATNLSRYELQFSSDVHDNSSVPG